MERLTIRGEPPTKDKRTGSSNEARECLGRKGRLAADAAPTRMESGSAAGPTPREGTSARRRLSGGLRPRALEPRGQPFGERPPPLIEGIHGPDHPLHEHLVRVERHQLAESGGIEPAKGDQRARAVPGV